MKLALFNAGLAAIAASYGIRRKPSNFRRPAPTIRQPSQLSGSAVRAPSRNFNAAPKQGASPAKSGLSALKARPSSRGPFPLTGGFGSFIPPALDALGSLFPLALGAASLAGAPIPDPYAAYQGYSAGPLALGAASLAGAPIADPFAAYQGYSAGPLALGAASLAGAPIAHPVVAYQGYSAVQTSGAQRRPVYVYVDHWESALEHSDLVNYIKDLVNAGASDVLLAFVVPGAGDALDTTGQYDRLTAGERTELKSFMADKGARLRMSIGGGNYGTTFMSQDPTTFANKWCSYASNQLYDGVDFDLEGFSAQSKSHPEMEWIKTAVNVCHQHVDLVSHAPQAPNIGSYSNYAFEGVIESSTDANDRFLIQFYNQPPAPYTTYESMFGADNVFYASIADIEKRIPSAKGKLVMGKYMYGFGSVGTLPVDDTVSILEQAEASGYTGGVMIWKSPAKGTAELHQFLNTDLPKLAGSGSAPVQPPTSSPGKATVPVVTHPVAPPSGSVVSVCQQMVGNPTNPAWSDDCKTKCDFYNGEGSLWCPEARDGSALAACVLRMAPGQCVAV